MIGIGGPLTVNILSYEGKHCLPFVLEYLLKDVCLANSLERDCLSLEPGFLTVL